MYILHPKTRRKIFLDNGISDYETRKNEVLTKVLTDDIINYCQDNAIIKNSRQELSHEISERILENCATYLLMGQFADNDIMTIFNIRKSQIMEIPASSSNSNAEDLLYSANFSDEISEKGLTASAEIKYNSDIKSEQQMSLDEISKKEKRQTKQHVRYKQSRAYRMERLFSTPEVQTYRIKQKFFVDEEGKRKPEKNAFGQPVFDAVYVTIGGNEGLIDKKNIYQSRWCTVDTENNFCYNDTRFKISEKLEQYQVQKDNKCYMDKIMIVPTQDGLVFFDQNIVRIPDNQIQVRQN